ncbi:MULTISPECIES: integrase family protein [unclassified Burkholderia]|uniref:tyrosine-type recombinase/integrase n=1 Tax=unclassified Burkholderia TaxID=2613784 RepID=UPI001424759D|nr:MULTISPECIES: integrase family protein [unclassified Burkholderia]NIE82361.1 integrase family protein [Burkholderia sp. Tr-860]NIF61647.1 integrase family protein [Burkholderia sp. Cy-647]NIF96169.1 integrase family protein [Burkholderia sp. Ax-1720]
MSKVNFTVARVDAHHCPDGKPQAFLWDSRAPGLGLRVTANGVKAYIFQSKVHGKTVRITIGDPRSFTIEKAQAEARRLQTLVSEGKDPREVAAAEKEMHARAREERLEREALARKMAEDELLRTSLLARTAWNAYMDAPHEKWGERHRADHIQAADPGGAPRKRGEGVTLAGPLAPLLDMPLSQVNADVVKAWFRSQQTTRKTMATNAYRKFRAFIRWSAASEQFRAATNADCCIDPAVKDTIPRQRAKEGDCLQREQLASWFSAVRAISNPVISAYLQGLLITGARREELASLKWTDVDFRWRSITLNDKIEGTGGRTIPLSPYLSELLLHLKHLNELPPNRRQVRELANQGKQWSPSPWVFASKKAGDGKLAEPRIAHNKALASVDLPHLSLHGLRRSFGTLSEWVEVPTGVVAQIQGHRPSAIAEKHYRRRPLDLLRKWHDLIEAWILEQADLEFSDF